MNDSIPSSPATQTAARLPESQMPSSPHEALPKVGRSFGWLAAFSLAFLLGVFVYLVGYGAVLGFEYAAQGIAAPNPEQLEARIQAHLLTLEGMVGVYLMQCLLIIPLVILAAHFPHQSWAETLAFKRFRARDLGFWALILLVFLGVQHVLSRALDIDPGEFMRSLSGSKHLPAAVILIVFAPLLEELIFRGYLFKAWRNTRLGLSGTLLLTSALFTVLHIGQYGWSILAMIFTLSIILGLAREKSGSLWVPIMLHAINNLVAAITVICFGWL